MEDAKVLDIKSVKLETPKAWLAILEDGIEIWFPKSQCSMGENTLKITVPEWLLRAKDIASWGE